MEIKWREGWFPIILAINSVWCYVFHAFVFLLGCSQSECFWWYWWYIQLECTWKWEHGHSPTYWSMCVFQPDLPKAGLKKKIEIDNCEAKMNDGKQIVSHEMGPEVLWNTVAWGVCMLLTRKVLEGKWCIELKPGNQSVLQCLACHEKYLPSTSSSNGIYRMTTSLLHSISSHTQTLAPAAWLRCLPWGR